MGFLETAAALLAFVTVCGAVGYFSAGGKKPPADDTADELGNVANAHYAKPRHLTDYGITDED
jgi:hypothetical protein